MTYRRVLFEHALDNHGLITTVAAKQLEVPTIELSKLASRGAISHVAYGVYRHEDVPPTRLSQFAEAVARVGRGAYLKQDAVLAMHELALVNPRSLRVATTRRVRRTLPRWIELVAGALDDVVVHHEGIASSSVADALADSVGLVPRTRLLDALEDARHRGLVRQREASALTILLERRRSPLSRTSGPMG